MNPDLFHIHAKMNKHTPADIVCRLQYEGSTRHLKPGVHTMDLRRMAPDNIAACKCGALFRVPDAQLDDKLQMVYSKARLLASPYYLGAMLDQHPEWARSLFYQLVYLDHQDYDPKLTYCMRNIIAFLAEGSGLKHNQVHLLACHYIGSPYIMRYGKDPLYTGLDEHIQHNLAQLMGTRYQPVTNPMTLVVGPEDIPLRYLDPHYESISSNGYLYPEDLRMKSLDFTVWEQQRVLEIDIAAATRLLSDEMADGLSA